jgi:hypothetical protein
MMSVNVVEVMRKRKEERRSRNFYPLKFISSPYIVTRGGLQVKGSASLVGAWHKG